MSVPPVTGNEGACDSPRCGFNKDIIDILDEG
jgi:hypothetical protein